MPQNVAGRLKIGLSACFQHADPTRSLFTNKTLQYVEQSIAHWLMSAGAMVVMVPCPTGETARGDTKLSHYAEWLDGVVMHGGADVWPGSYGEVPLQGRLDRRPHPRPLRPGAGRGLRAGRQADLRRVPRAAADQRGLRRHAVPGHREAARHPETLRHRDPVTYDQNFHDIEIVEGTRLSQLYPRRAHARVNSIHHQGIKDLAPGLRGRGLEPARPRARGDPPPRRRAAAATSRPRSGTRSSTSTAAPRRWTTRRSCTTSCGPAPPPRSASGAPCAAACRARSATARRGCCGRRCCGADRRSPGAASGGAVRCLPTMPASSNIVTCSLPNTGLQLGVGVDGALVGRVLQAVGLDVVPQLLDDLGARHRLGADHRGQRGAGLQAGAGACAAPWAAALAGSCGARLLGGFFGRRPALLRPRASLPRRRGALREGLARRELAACAARTRSSPCPRPCSRPGRP